LPQDSDSAVRASFGDDLRGGFAISAIDACGVLSKFTVAALSLGAIWWLVGDWAVIPFLLGIALATYAAIALADRLIESRSWRLAAAVLLATALYGGLLALNLAGIVGNLTGNPYSESLRNQWVITIGIGFYTLQIIGVAVDVMRRRIVLPPLLDYVFYILYLPKFLSGPIEQAKFLERVRDYRLRYIDENLATGLPWLVLGIFMKYGVADSVSRLVDIEYLRPLGVFVMTALFELRVYFDWAGYSLMAYGAAWCLGLPVMLNFAQPLFAHNPQELWRRWHVSLGRWLHTYLYLPLREGLPYPLLLSFLAPICVFLISAMWHGASFNFLLWGIFHASAYLLFVKVLRHLSLPRLLGIAGFVFLLLVGRLLFMDDDTARLLTKMGNLVSFEAWRADLEPAAVRDLLDHFRSMELTKAGIVGVLVAIGVIFVEWLNERRHPDRPYHLLTQTPAVVLLLVVTLLIVSSTDVGFVYARH
jgi:D-alanyl-lipoteichoic acid acyltransferase DltB (MBOAT superfamily)